VKGFNPYRVFKFVATALMAMVGSNIYKVSIPIGFSSSLQLKKLMPSRPMTFSFNPYRVFKFVATEGDRAIQRRHGGFNPYRVFKFVATATSDQGS